MGDDDDLPRKKRNAINTEFEISILKRKTEKSISHFITAESRKSSRRFWTNIDKLFGSYLEIKFFKIKMTILMSIT